VIKLLLKIAIPVILCLLVYNYFFGTPEEKDTSKAVFAKTKELSVSIYDLLKSEKHKFDEGKYDKALDKLNQIYATARSNNSHLSESDKSELQKLEAEKQKLQTEIDQTKRLDQKAADEKSKSLDEKLMELVDKTNKLLGQ